MSDLTAVWKRHDIPALEACRVIQLDDSWRLVGTAVFLYENEACSLSYQIGCDANWVTRSTLVTGWLGRRTIEINVVHQGNGRWQLNQRDSPAVQGCTDVDLNFSPATNLLPIRRLNLEIGATAQVRAAWVRFPSFELEPLEQSYTRLKQNLYRYESAGGRFVAELTVDEAGLVVDYGKVWSREVAQT